jgi:prophage regulatory protein
MSTTTATPKGYRLPDMMLRTGLKKTAIYAAIKRGELPEPKKLGRASVWPSEVIDRIINPAAAPASPASPTTAASS